jgi:pimeloyl-ACP methyl ester carboxylesterase
MHPARRRIGWPLRIVFAVVAGIALALAIDVVRSGGPAAWLGRHGIPLPYVAAGQRFDIGGRSLYLDCRGSGSPTIILEAGMGGDAGTWSHVLDDAASITRTCAYDRAGRGRSDPHERFTLADAAADLRALLDAAGEKGPFIIAGHSLGGAYGRVFAAAHRDDVAGLLLVDGFNPDLQSDYVHPLLGDLRPGYERALDGLRDLVSGVERLDWSASEVQMRTADLVGLPVNVLVPPRQESRLDEETNVALAAAWRDAFESLSPGRVDYEIAWGSDHFVQHRRPDLVVASLRRLVDLARGG